MRKNFNNSTYRCKTLFVPEFWLCYLAPEIMKRLTTKRTDDLLPFTEKSDVYAFGYANFVLVKIALNMRIVFRTIWYELLTGEFPFKRFPPDAIVWQVGRGIKPALNNLHAAREIKVGRILLPIESVLI
jgi:kinase suppressor of Ras 2